MGAGDALAVSAGAGEADACGATDASVAAGAGDSDAEPLGAGEAVVVCMLSA